MAINNTGAMFKSFEFDGTDSRDFGVYITGSGVYDAPEREVEMISIPNRNGAFALDKGRFENIEVTYPAGIYADTESDFAEAISDLRNFLCSKRGYCRLTDEYNPNEYRMAIYKSGLEVEPALLKAGEFEITFECMPQRYLNTGDDEITVTNGQTITNPTLFDAGPLLMVNGYGTINVNDHEVNIDDISLGEIVLKQGQSNVNSFEFDTDLIDNGDPISINTITTVLKDTYQYTINDISAPSYSISNTNAQCGSCTVNQTHTDHSVTLNVAVPKVTFTAGTSGSTTITMPVTVVDTTSTTHHLTFKFIVQYNGAAKITFKQVRSAGIQENTTANYIDMTANSSVSALGNPTYIDCDAGVCYKIVNNELISLDGTIDLGAELPYLKTGANTITFDNTVTGLKMKTRWWKV